MIGLFICLLGTAIFGYFVGSANTAILVGKAYGVDIRTKGSGNAGMTNTMRTLGIVAGILVILGDMFKAFISCIVGYLAIRFFAPEYLDQLGSLGSVIGGFAVVAGHIWPVYFRFKGGKGVLTAFTALLTIDYKPALVSLALFLIIILLTRYVSLGSIIGTLSFPISATLFKGKIESWYIILIIIMCALIVYMHKGNISRLLKGTESKIGKGKPEGNGTDGGEKHE